MPGLKKFLCLIILFVTGGVSAAKAQWQYPFLEEYFFSRTPSARMEAMGKAYAPVESDMSCVFKNPAGISTVPGLSFDFSYSSPYYSLEDAKYLFAGAGYTINKYTSIATAVNRLDYGIKLFVDNGTPVPTQSGSPHLTNYSFSFASNPLKNFNIGITANYFIIDYPAVDTKGVLFPDIGAIKYFDIGKKEKVKHIIFAAQSFSNFTKAKAVFTGYGLLFQSNGESSTNELPVISRTSAGYTISTRDSSGEKSLKSHQGTIVFEYEDELNSKYATSFRFGFEYTLFSILSWRAGYYHQKIDDFGYPEYNKSQISAFTYGIGFALPLELITKSKTPLTLKFDFANLEQPPHAQKRDYKNFTSLNFSLNYVFKKKL
jgi:hypothetical protein